MEAKEKTEQFTLRLPVSFLRDIEAAAEAEHITRAARIVQLIYIGYGWSKANDATQDKARTVGE